MKKKSEPRSAVTLANQLRREQSHVHRGSMKMRRKCEPAEATHVIFGNDGYSTSARPAAQVGLLRESLKDHAVTEVGFGLDDGGVTWAMLVVSNVPAAFLTELVWKAWAVACGVSTVRQCDAGHVRSDVLVPLTIDANASTK